MCKKCPLNEVEYMTRRDMVMATRQVWGPQWIDADVSTTSLAEPRDIPVICYSSEERLSVRVELSARRRILKLVERGMSAKKVKARLNLDMTPDQINRLARDFYGPRRRGGNGALHSIPSSTYPYVVEALRRLGKDPYWCETCEERQDKRCVVHHTKYEGATVYDLQYACDSCNRARANIGLM